MRRILIIQADQRSCDIIQNTLQPKIGDWDISFVWGVKESQNQLEKGPWDLVIADLVSENDRLFLDDVRGAFPEVVRFGLVRESRPSPTHVSVVHQFLAKPFALKELEVAVERCFKLRDILHSESISRMVGDLGSLPSVPRVYMKLVDTLNQQNASIDEVAKVIECDMAISSKILQLVNSAIFRTRREIATVRLATSFLGLNLVKNLVLSTEVFGAFERMPRISGFSIEELQIHSRFTAGIAGSIYVPNEARDAAIVASLLHDIGKLVLAWKMPDRFARLVANARAQQRPLYQIEEEDCGVTHAEIGAYLLGLWGLPLSVTEAIAFHHVPSQVPHYHFDAVGAVYVANVLAHELDGSLKEGHDLWDCALLADLDIAHKLPVWAAMAQEMKLSQYQTLQVSRR